MNLALVVTAFGWGLRHGVDWDHLVAIADLTAAQDDRRRARRLAGLYVVGHAAMLLALGVAAVLAGRHVPAWLDDSMGRVVGATLVVLGLYLLVGSVRPAGTRLRSRWTLLLVLARRVALRRRRAAGAGGEVVIEHEHEHQHTLGDHHHHDDLVAPVPEPAAPGPVIVARTHPDAGHDHLVHAHPHPDAVHPHPGHAHPHPVHTHRHVHRGRLPDDPFAAVSAPGALAVGAIHGVGAETPTQILVLASAAGAGSTTSGLATLLAFLGGLVLMNAAVAVAASTGFVERALEGRAGRLLALGVGSLSLVLGLVYALDLGKVPALLS